MNTRPKTLCVLIHGFSAKDSTSYWGLIPDYLRHDSKCGIDIIIEGYPTNKSITFDLILALLGRVRLPVSERIARQIFSRIAFACSKKKYDVVLVIGHSYGGLIAVQAGSICAKNGLPVKAICLSASPGSTNRFALMHSLILGGNAQSRELAGNAVYQKVYRSIIPKVKARLDFWYLEATSEEVVREPPHGMFRRYMTHPGRHNWLQDVVNRNHMGYRFLLDFVDTYAV